MKLKSVYSDLAIIILFFFVVTAGLNEGCKKSTVSPSASTTSTTSTSTGGNGVLIQNMSFSPASITVAVNSTVVWTNKDAVTHTVTSTTGLFDSGNITSGSVYSHQFTATGTYPYKCTIHAGMTGSVTVQ